MSDDERSKDNDAIIFWGALVGLVLTWHTSLVLATADHGFSEFGDTVRAIFDKDPLHVDGHDANLFILIAVWVLILAAVAGIIVWRFRRKGHDHFYATAKEFNEMGAGAPSEKVQPFAKIDNRWVYLFVEDTTLVCAPPRIGKTARVIIGMILDADGPTVVTSTKADVMRLTMKARLQRKNPDGSPAQVHVFDPTGVSKWPHRATWNIVAGCEDQLEAAERARAIVAARPMSGAEGIDVFADGAETILQCLLHAAALADKDIRAVLRWARDFTDEEPYAILRSHERAGEGWVDDLRSHCRGKAERTVASYKLVLGQVLKPLKIGDGVDSVRAGGGSREFNVERFLDSQDTLYLLSESGDTTSMAPIITALVSTLERAARKKSQHTRTTRLERPVHFILDEGPNIAPIPSLPSLFADGGGRGIRIVMAAQSYSQLEDRWGQSGARTILNAAGAKIIMGGLSEDAFLTQISTLVGETKVESVTKSSTGTSVSESREWKLPASALRKIPTGQALCLYRNLRPAMLTLDPWWERDDAAQIARGEGEVLDLEGIK